MTTYGIKISKPGIDIKSATAQEQIFNSEYVHPKLYTIDRISGKSFEIAHPFGYPPSTAGYVNHTIFGSEKYFVHYDLGYYRGYEFENDIGGDVPITGTIRTDSQKVYLDCSYDDALVALTFADPAIGNFDALMVGAQSPGKDIYGIKISRPRVDVKAASDYQLSVTSDYQTFSIVQTGTITVSLPAITTDYANAVLRVDQTAYVDANHSLGYPGHIVVLNEQVFANIGYYPGGVGTEAPIVFTDSEVYVDSQKIRFRMSRTAEAFPMLADASADAASYRMKYFLTNYNLRKV